MKGFFKCTSLVYKHNIRSNFQYKMAFYPNSNSDAFLYPLTECRETLKAERHNGGVPG